MHKNYKVDKQVITNIIHRHIKTTKPQKQIKLIIDYTKFKHPTLSLRITQTNVAYKFTYPF